ncbi:hypothetical protein GPA_32470 [Gordonibacter pamelaeae 7-10-1-b]|uniref:Uncharacterized protein n=1 Tax=Gordonibacter pamelaeae 7-10-1-b TaxID=657308 RepID=D6EBF6_9ACTN|nr:hypothetical protein GPA_32470 [Gordonibacter pamelaeae 7-10-1-b]
MMRSIINETGRPAKRDRFPLAKL